MRCWKLNIRRVTERFKSSLKAYCRLLYLDLLVGRLYQWGQPRQLHYGPVLLMSRANSATGGGKEHVYFCVSNEQDLVVNASM